MAYAPVEVGRRYGRWVVKSPADPIFYGKAQKRFYRWNCECDCGTLKAVTGVSLKSGTSNSCGCYNIECSVEANIKHGGSLGGINTPEYSAWHSMKARCYNTDNNRYHDYGGRGIEVCPEWKENFPQFLADMGERPTPQHSLDRSDNEKGYNKDNCVWSLPHKQMTNRRNSVHIEYKGENTPVSDLCKEYGIVPAVFLLRIRAGWSIEKALTTPVRTKTKNGFGPPRKS